MNDDFDNARTDREMLERSQREQLLARAARLYWLAVDAEDVGNHGQAERMRRAARTLRAEADKPR